MDSDVILDGIKITGMGFGVAGVIGLVVGLVSKSTYNVYKEKINVVSDIGRNL